MSKVLRHHILPLAAYAILALVVLWPMPSHPASTIAGGGDAPWFLWDLWWFKRALFQLGVSPFRTDRIYFPLTDVPVQWQTPWNEALMAPLSFGLPLPLVYNILIVATYALTGYGTYLLLSTVTRNRTVAFAGGLLFAFCGYRNVRALGHLSLLTTQWIPFLALAGIQMWKRPSLTRGLVLGVMAACVSLSSPYYTGMVMLPMALAGGLYVLITQPRRLLRRELWWAGGVAAGALILIAAPFYADYLRQDADVYALTRSLGSDTENLSADLLSYILPPERNPVWGHVTNPIFRQLATSNAAETTLFVGLAVIVLALASVFLVRRLPRSVLFWQMLALISIVLSFGPTLKLHGQTIVAWMPFTLFARIPGFYSFRVPSRFGVTATLALIVLAGLVTAWIVRNWSRRTQRIVVYAGSAIILFNSLYMWPFMTSDVTIPEFYAAIRDEPGDRAVLSLPGGADFAAAFRFDFYEHMGVAMYDQTLHGKPLVSGYLARRPERLYDFERNSPFVRRFFNPDPLQPMVSQVPLAMTPLGYLPADVLFGNDFLYQDGIGNVVFDCAALGGSCAQAYAMMRGALGLPWAEENGTLVFRVTEPHRENVPDLLATAAIAPGDGIEAVVPGTAPHQLAVGPGAALTMSVPLAGIWRLQGDFTGSAAADATILVDGAPITLTTFAAQTPVPAHLFEAMLPLAAGEHRIEIRGSDPPSGTDRCESLCLSHLSVTLQQPALEDAASLVTFADDAGHLVGLQGARIVETRAANDDGPRAWLVTQWNVAGNDPAGLLSANEEDAPTLFVHLTDADGTTLLQSDHLFRERVLSGDDPATFLDIAELPSAMGGDATQIRLGLWYPQRDAWFWATEPERVDHGQRYVFTRDALPLTHIEIPEDAPDPAVRATFTYEGVPVSWELLNARLLDASYDNCGLLATTWRTQGYDLGAAFPPTDVPATLAVHYTGPDGAILASRDKPFTRNDATLLAGNRLLMLLDVPCEVAENPDAEIRLLMWNPDTGERFSVRGEAPMDGEARVLLGRLNEADELQ